MGTNIANWSNKDVWNSASAQTGLPSFLGGDTAKTKKFLIELQSVALRNQKFLDKSTPKSLIMACREAALLDLSLDGREAAVVPFKGHAKMIIMTAGLIKLAFRNPDILRIQGFVVRENDVFNYCPGTNKLTHEVDYLLSDSDRGDLVAAYAVAEIARGNRTASVYAICSKDYIMKCKSISSSSHKSSSPWQTWEEEMYKKTAVRKLFGMIPLEGGNIPDEVSFEPEQNQANEVKEVNEVNTPPPVINPPSVEQPTIEVAATQGSKSKQKEQFDFNDEEFSF